MHLFEDAGIDGAPRPCTPWSGDARRGVDRRHHQPATMPRKAYA